MVVKCEPGEDGGLDQTFFLEVYNSGEGQLQQNLTSTRGPVFELQGLPSSVSYVLVLYAANAKGRSNLVTLSAATTPFPAGSTFGKYLLPHDL